MWKEGSHLPGGHAVARRPVLAAVPPVRFNFNLFSSRDRSVGRCGCCFVYILRLLLLLLPVACERRSVHFHARFARVLSVFCWLSATATLFAKPV